LLGRSTAATREELVSEPKPGGRPFAISKRLVWEAWLRVKANKGAEGVDEESIQAFEANLREPLQALESDVLGELHTAAGQGGADTEERRTRIEDARRAHRRR
jgi:hypothetical protein